MQTEIEAKFLEIDPEALREKLRTLGAELQHPERLMRRKNFDYLDKRLEKIGGWVRVRDEGDRTTLSYKQLNDRTLHGTQEVSVTVDDFEKTCRLLAAIGLVEKAVQETRREKWVLGDVEVTIDTWPWIPTFVEIEGTSEAAVRAVAEKLGLDWRLALHGSVEVAYQKHFDATEEEIYNYPSVIFGPVPDWLEAKRRR